MSLIGKLSRLIIAVLFTSFVTVVVIFSLMFFSWKKVWESSVKRWAKITLKILCIQVQITGEKNLSTPAIFIMNHTSIVDIIIFLLISPKKSVILAKKEVRRIPLLTKILSLGGAIFIDRSEPSKSISSILQG